MKTFIMIASAVVLFSTAASANSVTIKCSDNVERGTLKLSNPPTMNCDDLNLMKTYVGSGITVGPNSKVNDLVSAIESIQPVTEVSTEPLNDKFSGTRRHAKWFEEKPSERTSCPPQDVKWINLKFNEDGGVTIKR